MNYRFLASVSNNLAKDEYQHGLLQSLDYSGRSGAQVYKNFTAENIRMENYQCLLSFLGADGHPQ